MTKAVFLACGKGERMWPLTLDRPKGMLTAYGEVLVERQVRQLVEAGVDDITFVVSAATVTGYAPIIERYDCRVITNDSPDDGNWVTLSLAGNLDDCFVCSVDDWFESNPFFFKAASWYGVSSTDAPRDEWFVDGNVLESVRKEAGVGRFLCGCAYFCVGDGERMTSFLGAYDGDRGAMWEDVLLDNVGDFDMLLRDIDVREFDTVRELLDFDSACLEKVGNGATNDTYLFGDKVLRVPGVGCGDRLDRVNELLVERRVNWFGIDTSFIEMRNGVKLSRLVKGKELDPRDHDDLVMAMGVLRKIHMVDGRGVRRRSLAERCMSEVKLSDNGELMALAERLCVDLPTVGKCLCHGDFHPGNILVEGGKPVVIDWEYASVGDRFDDIGLFLSCVDYDRREAEVFLDRFADEPSVCVRYATIASLMWTAWCENQVKSGVDVGGWDVLCGGNLKMYLEML